MKNRKASIIDWILLHHKNCGRNEFRDFTHFKQVYHQESSEWDIPIDRAVLGGFISDRLSYSFWAGIQAGIQSLSPELPADSVVSFCVTEESGNNPKNIMTRLTENGCNSNGEKIWKLNGEKKFITSALEADILLVAASAGFNPDGMNMLRIVSLNSNMPGIVIEPMKEIIVTPEFSHCYIRLNNVEIHDEQIYKEDAFTEYMKPFRTVEDIYVAIAILAYLFGAACRYDWPRGVKEDILCLIISFRALSRDDPKAPDVHIALGSLLFQVKRFIESIESLWNKADDAVVNAWKRDVSIINIAEEAQSLRLKKAWEYYKGTSIN